MARVDLIEDDVALAEAVASALRGDGHSVRVFHDGARGDAEVRSSLPDCVITDVGLPGVDGFTLVRRARAASARVAILVLTGRDTEIDEALALDLGADDYIAKPVGMSLLLARVRAVLRRVQPAPSHGPLIATRRLCIDVERLEASLDGRVLTLTVSELRLLEVLAQRPGVVRTRGFLLEAIRPDNPLPDPRIVDTYVARIRREARRHVPELELIETVVGVGYRLGAGA